MAWEVEVTDEFVRWYDGLSEREQERIGVIIDELSEKGPHLTYPKSSGIRGPGLSHLRELRIQVGGRPFRIFYAFDPRQTAILLVGGDKTGVSDRRFYARYLPSSNRLYNEYIVELEREGLI